MADTQFLTNGQTDGRTDGRTDGAILICHPKFLRGHKNIDKWTKFKKTKISRIVTLVGNTTHGPVLQSYRVS